MDNQQQTRQIFDHAYKALFHLDRPYRAIKLAKQMLFHEPDSLPAFWILTEAHYINKKTSYDDAYNAAKQWLNLDPENPYALWRFGTLLQEKENYSGANQYLKKAVALISDDDRLWHSYALNMMKLGNIESGKDFILKAIDLNPNNPDYYHILGFYFQEKKQYESAELNFMKAIKMNPENPVYFNDYGYMLSKTNRIKEAVPFFRKAFANELKNPIYRVNYVQSLKGIHPLRYFFLNKKRYGFFIILWIPLMFFIFGIGTSSKMKALLFFIGVFIFPFIFMKLIDWIAVLEFPKRKKG